MYGLYRKFPHNSKRGKTDFHRRYRMVPDESSKHSQDEYHWLSFSASLSELNHMLLHD